MHSFMTRKLNRRCGPYCDSFRLDWFMREDWCLIGMFHNTAEPHRQMNNQCVTQASVGHLNCSLDKASSNGIYMLLSSKTQVEMLCRNMHTIRNFVLSTW